MNINYLAFLDPTSAKGGGEMILSQLLQTAERRGHDLRVSSALPKQHRLHPSPDLTLVADLFNCPESAQKLPLSWIKEATSGAYVHLDTAYVDCCNLDYLPCSGKSQDPCPHKGKFHLKRNLRSGDFSGQCFARSEGVQQLYNRSQLNVFLSPLHQQTIQEVVGFDPSHPSFILRPMIDTETFKDRNLSRDLPQLFAGVFCEAKGAETLKQQYSDRDIHFIGGDTQGRPKFGTDHGQVAPQAVADWMNRAQEFVYLPRWPEPQGRVVVEAALCGCQLTLNQQVGAASFGVDLSEPKHSQGAAEEFWERLEQLEHSKK